MRRWPPRSPRPEAPRWWWRRTSPTATRAEAVVRQTVERFGRLDILANNAGLMLLGPVVGADPQEWERMIGVNVRGLLHTTRAVLRHLLKADEKGPRQVADIVNISSIAGRQAWANYGNCTSPSSA
ncbi:SDR family NAD(P)-dependent oxidoreductase [Streptomyces sp. IB2014 016-6]|uniref:SDR family oxidoreductase n=1 Tax=Streptomyces sp. IB2014 016-6 TaxID=2517818 RepID=UPI00240E0F2D|nr:SDR family NAD(P)-dependent oxidoreductase [Streptomyces sp. IB2014 016-6]